MKIKPLNIGRDKLTRKLQGLVYRLDNIANADMNQNGEREFLKQIAQYYKNEAITVLDVGANLGHYSQIILEQRREQPNDQYHLFEPQRDCFIQLQTKFEKQKKIRLNNFGLSKENQENIIYKDQTTSGLASLYRRDLTFYNLKMDLIEKIKLIRAEDYLKTNPDIKKIHLLKLDIEGHELLALNGFGSYLNHQFVDFLQFEYGGANLDSRTNLLDFYHLLEPAGFVICRIRRWGLEILPYHPRLENFVNQNLVAVNRQICQNLKV